MKMASLSLTQQVK